MLIPAVQRYISGTGTLEDALLALQQQIGGGGSGTTVTVPTVSFVTPNGNDVTAQRGNPDKPFATINAAIAAMYNGDVLSIAPPPNAGDVWAENVVVPALDGSGAPFQKLTLRGASRDSTIIKPAAGIGLSWTKNNAGIGAEIELIDLTIEGHSTSPGIEVVCTSLAKTQPSRVVMSNIHTSAITLVDVGAVLMNDVVCDGITELDNPGGGRISNLQVGDLLHISYQGSSAVYDRGEITFTSLLGQTGILLEHQPDVLFDKSCEVKGTSSNALTLTADTYFNAPRDYAALVTYLGALEGDVSCTFAPVQAGQTATHQVNAEGTLFDGDVDFAGTATDTRSVASVNAFGAQFTAGVNLGPSVILFALNALLPPTIGVVGADSQTACARSFAQTLNVDISAGTPVNVPISPPFPAGDTDYQVAVTPTAAPSPYTISAKALNQFTITPTGAVVGARVDTTVLLAL